ncbi:hypothetical protein [Paraburkholderia ginsengiterrae]|nr:hypothetical protein [Paraburkholderia ginsengiterrae]
MGRVMLRLRFRQFKDATEGVDATGGYRRIIVARQNQRRWCFRLAVTASMIALLAMSLGFAKVGIAVYIAAILPFAFFS